MSSAPSLTVSRPSLPAVRLPAATAAAPTPSSAATLLSVQPKGGTGELRLNLRPLSASPGVSPMLSARSTGSAASHADKRPSTAPAPAGPGKKPAAGAAEAPGKPKRNPVRRVNISELQRALVTTSRVIAPRNHYSWKEVQQHLDIDPRTLRSIRHLFDTYDVPQQGYLTRVLFDRFLQDMDMARGFLGDSIFRRWDRSNHGCVDRREFASMVYQSATWDEEEELRYVFCCYDLDHTGRINRSNLIDLIKSAAGPVDGTEALTMCLLDRFDRAGDGTIQFDEFKKACERTPDFLEVFGKVKPPVKLDPETGEIIVRKPAPRKPVAKNSRAQPSSSSSLLSSSSEPAASAAAGKTAAASAAVSASVYAASSNNTARRRYHVQIDDGLMDDPDLMSPTATA